MQRTAKTVTDDGAMAEVDALMRAVRGQRVHDTGLAPAEQHEGKAADVKAADLSRGDGPGQSFVFRWGRQTGVRASFFYEKERSDPQSLAQRRS
jgi:hypothetical protein